MIVTGSTQSGKGGVRMRQMVYRYCQEQKKNGKLFLAENHFLLSDVRPDTEDYTGAGKKEYLPKGGPWAKTVRAVPVNTKSV